VYKNDEGLTTTKNFPRTISLVRRTPLMIASQVKTIRLAEHDNINFSPLFHSPMTVASGIIQKHMSIARQVTKTARVRGLASF